MKNSRDPVGTGRCIAFVHSEAHDELWTPCTNATADESLFCPTHRDAIDGAMMGLVSRRPTTEQLYNSALAEMSSAATVLHRLQAPIPSGQGANSK